ncbi:tyrosine decarboxylase MfnA [Halococcus saccharolyticus]|uniref:Probable L-aspartate decarboxylase n=1 Tax=Halococcus saccharolyticus DSM 5350 TaxID=1227455 RepID=M0MPV4_9EURY|nr:tyrosine decarboxylase MfnA [Halococcus saccharolyticus]EMA46764.1 L-tyrosine decarboxylase [Halococcus saccharolyticus DSM 5350]
MQRATPQEFSRVLSSMCTEPHPAARAAAEEFLATNPGDPATYETVADLEREAVSTLGEIAGHPEAAGYITSGGTEANLQAMRIARDRGMHGGAAGDPATNGRANIVAPASVHFSFQKAAAVLGLELRTAPLGDEYRADPEVMAELVDSDTVAVVGVAGSTEYGRIDPIPAITDLAREAGVLCHVDAAWGGFHLPFTDHDWQFGHADIDTLTIDPHKLGQAAVPAGGLLARSSSLLNELAIDTPYLESASQASLTGTRSGAGVASAAAAMDELWPDGYREQAERSQANADWLAAAFDERGYDVVEPELPLVAADLPESEFDALREVGWRIARTATGDLRVVCMPHVTRETLRRFVTDLDRVE